LRRLRRPVPNAAAAFGWEYNEKLSALAQALAEG
jgi:hypothetical protein